MSVRFASTNHPVRRLGWRAAGRGLVAPALARAVNDNGEAGASGDPLERRGSRFDPVLTEALRHFAVHGLASAEAACDEAEAAARRGDAPARAHWLAITGMFDRRRLQRSANDPVPAPAV